MALDLTTVHCEVFKQMFLETIVYYTTLNQKKLNTFKITYFENDVYKSYGMNEIFIKAYNWYDLWLKLYLDYPNIIDIYNYFLIMCMINDKKKENDNIVYRMELIVNEYMTIFIDKYSKWIKNIKIKKL